MLLLYGNEVEKTKGAIKGPNSSQRGHENSGQGRIGASHMGTSPSFLPGFWDGFRLLRRLALKLYGKDVVKTK